MQVKKQFKWFTIFEYEKEQDYLREMHKSGWKFIKATLSKKLAMYVPDYTQGVVIKNF